MKRSIKRVINGLGYEIRTLSRQSSHSSRETLDRLLDRNAELLIFDVGAHRGQSASSYAERFPRSKVLSFEPYSPSFRELERLRSERLIPYNFGFSDVRGASSFSVNRSSATNSLLELSDTAGRTWGSGLGLVHEEVTECMFRTLDDFLEEQRIDAIDFMKVDVQGAEYRVLAGGDGALAKKKIKAIQLELIVGETYEGQRPLSYYFALFDKYNYRLHSIVDQVSSDGGVLVQFDAVFTA